MPVADGENRGGKARPDKIIQQKGQKGPVPDRGHGLGEVGNDALQPRSQSPG